MKLVTSVVSLLLAIGHQVSAVSVGTDATALLIIDVQDCFMEASGTLSGADGSLSVANTSEIIPLLNSIRTEKSCLFDTVIRSQDYHTEAHISFGPTHGLEPFAHLFGKGELLLTCVNPSSGLTKDASCCPTYHIEPYNCETFLCPSVADSPEKMLASVMSSPACTICKETPEECFSTTQAMWTEHCKQDGDSNFPPTLYTEDTDIIVQKGDNQYVDAYSAFMDNTRKLKTPLDSILTEKGITTIYIAGIATDYCVYYSTVDALGLGYEVKLILDATRAISVETAEAAKADMLAKGATIVSTADVLAMECPSASGAFSASFLGTSAAFITALVVNTIMASV
jgi:nicotinamidase-related amidase